MELHCGGHADASIVAVSGVVDSASAGQLLDEIVAACLSESGTTLTVDLAGVTGMTRAGARGFVVAAKLAQCRGGAMRVTGARPTVESVLAGLGYSHLFRFDQTDATRASTPGMQPERHPAIFGTNSPQHP